MNTAETIPTTVHKGHAAEEYVAHALQQQGYTVLARNYRWRGGEIDIIVRKGSVVAFVEVKMRVSHYFDLSEVINPSKQRKILQTGRYFMGTYKDQQVTFQCDVALLHAKADGTLSMEYIPSAFTDHE